ncbi:hypothetical protein [Flavobacterium cellulosilyticum]|uniref:DUF2219 family protein n=1 Tax=Flavobacterium cellulosilyticum TaxID=2541731 RepID=A0A4R5C6F6_9FLAO|nr:hypothetical protein [Flavobacterium cellulosilyticum]TDD94126.1 hypothetical protein E0F76_17700 [Flavobacterium cellulosilyticum]
MRKLYSCLILFLCSTIYGQKSFNDFAQFYPIGEDPSVRYMTSYTKQETILFEANPIIRYSLYNNFMKGLMDENQKHTQAWYIAFKPQLRMYTDNSLPVRTPSYKILLGTQHLFRINATNTENQNFWGFSLESGHYSNGQDGSSFSELYPDGSPEGDAIYNTIDQSTDLSKIINRRSGNFSTNLTEIIFNYRTYKIDDDNVPKQLHSFNLGYTLYHNRFVGIGNFGGYTPNDIKIYGRHRLSAGYEFMKVLQKLDDKRFSIKQNLELIEKPHQSVNPFRSESIVTFYPFTKSKTVGFFVSYIYGHDNYNLRLVDSGHQATFGITWSQFPPFSITNKL